MSYIEYEDSVALHLSREDYETLLVLLGVATAHMEPKDHPAIAAFLNRLNNGNPNYTPYIVKPKL